VNGGGGSPLRARQGSTRGGPSAGGGRGHGRRGGRGGGRHWRRPRPAAAGRSPAASPRWRRAFGPPLEAGTDSRRPGWRSPPDWGPRACRGAGSRCCRAPAAARSCSWRLAGHWRMQQWPQDLRNKDHKFRYFDSNCVLRLILFLNWIRKMEISTLVEYINDCFENISEIGVKLFF
jgi:hypothetical protein